MNRSSDFQLDVCSSEKVASLKMRIERIQNILLESQTLVYNNTVMKNSVLLSQYGIKDNASIFLIEGYGSKAFRVDCQKPDGEIVELKVDPYTTVYDIKLMIEALDKADPYHQCITYEGKTLEDSSTVLNCSLYPDCILTMSYFKTEVNLCSL